MLTEPTFTAELAEHLQHLQDTWQRGLTASGFDAAWIEAGEDLLHFRDDQGPLFKANAYLTQWVPPAYLSAGARLLVQADARPQLFLPRPEDYWHSVPSVPEHLGNMLDVHTFASMAALTAAAESALPVGAAAARVGPAGLSAAAAGENEQTRALNPAALLHYLDFHRACKTAHELTLMRQASEIGARGHRAARSAFAAGQPEFAIHMAYLSASAQNEQELPYGNIVAMNEHAAILHYQHQDRSLEGPPLSLLIDAGGQFQGYASDITRTYAAEGARHTVFRDLIDAMQAHQDKLIGSITVGMTYAELHDSMHRGLAELLAQSELVTCSSEDAYRQGITRAFCPHGLGHLLGLQVHDAGGHLADDQGNPLPPPEAYPSLRFTRAIQAGQVFTIEPGLYFMPQLLQPLREAGAPVNWQLVDALVPYGGIRIEDNIHVLPDGCENLTRDAFARL